MTQQLHTELKDYFKEVVQGGRLSHGYLFTGHNFPLKEQLTHYIIQLLACPHQDSVQGPCGECALCQRIAHDQYSDVLYVQPEGKQIKVDQIRELKDWLVTSPVEADFKLAVITQAETMNRSAANALLAFLEEPVAGVYLILFSQSEADLLPTIVSRVQRIHLQSAEVDTAQAQLEAQGIKPAHARIALQLTTSAVEELLTDYDMNEWDQWLKTMNQFYQALIQRNAGAFIAVETQLKRYFEGLWAYYGLNYLLLVNHDLLIWLEGTDTPLHLSDYQLQQWQQAAQPQLTDLLSLNDALLKAKEYLAANVSPQVTYEALALSCLSQ